MNDSHWNQPDSRALAAQGAPSSSVGSLPAPADALRGALPHDADPFARGPAARTLAGHWREAFLAERALGWVLWGALALVIVLVSR